MSDPRAEGRVALQHAAGVHLYVCGAVGERVHVERLDDRHLVHVLGGVREGVGAPKARLAAPLELPNRAENFLLTDAAATHLDVDGFAVMPGQFRLVVEQVHLAWPAVHVQVDAGLGLRREMRFARLERIGVVGQRGGRGGEHLFAGENAGQRHASHRRAEPLHELAPAELLYKFRIHRFTRTKLPQEK